MRAWVNGQLLDDPTGPAVSVTDHGFTVGDGVFEAVKVVDNQPFALTRHLERLARSARGLGLPEVDLEEVRRGVTAVVDGQELPLGRIRITYTGGEAPLSGPGRSVMGPAGLLDRHRLRQVARLVDVGALKHRDVIRQ